MIRVLVSMEAVRQNGQKSIPAYGAYASYIQKLSRYNIAPLFVCPTMTKDAINYLYNLADGVYFMGGSDFDPSHYKEKKHKKTIVTEAPRDQLELDLLKRTLEDKKPFLGICRGCQALAIASGGTLIQHIPDMVGHGRHSLENGQPYEALATNGHHVIVEKTSRIYKILKKERITVASGHHQAASSVGKNFKITGNSEDGIAEIIEHTDPTYFCFATQSHPEVETKGNMEPLFAAFSRAASAYNKNRKNKLIQRPSILSH